MNFQTLQKVENPQTYLDHAMHSGEEAVGRMKMQKVHLKGQTRFEKSKRLELARLAAIRDALSKSLGRILKSFPMLSSLPTFYYELTRTAIDYYLLKKSLGTVNWGRSKVDSFHRIYSDLIKKTQEFDEINRLRREFIGRISSVAYQMDEAFKFLEHARKTMKEFPTIKTGTKTVVIAGFPNVGKTTLLYKLTGSKPEISGYAFTTKTINVAYFKLGDEKIQVLDTPGTLNRFNKMNMIEKQAYLAMKYCSDIFVYVYDLTEPYPLKDQEKMLEIVKSFDRPIIIYLSKADIADRKKIEDYARKKDAVFDPEELKARVDALLKEKK